MENKKGKFEFSKTKNFQKESNSLLEKAKSFGHKNRLIKKDQDEVMEVALAWIKGEISTTQVSYALTGNIRNNCLRQLANSLKLAYLKGRIVVD